MSVCFACKKTVTKVSACSVCKQAQYCSKECQRAAWPEHKKACKMPEERLAPVKAATAPKAAPKAAAKAAAAAPKLSAATPGAATAAAAPSSPHYRAKPTADMFPEALRQFTFVESADGVNTNLLLLFHGLGDGKDKYTQLARQMRLPQTAALVLRAPNALPLDMGFAWYDAFTAEGELIAPAADERRREQSLRRTRALLAALVDAVTARCGYPLHCVFLLGFSSGAHAAVDLALHYGSPRQRFGGLVCIASSLIEEDALRIEQVQKQQAKAHAGAADAKATDAKADGKDADAAALAEFGSLRGCPVLCVHGRRDQRVSESTAQRCFAALQTLQTKVATGATVDLLGAGAGSSSKAAPAASDLMALKVYPSKGHEMISSRDEATGKGLLAVLRFLTRSL